jgi:outer membrane protein TolC
MQYKILNTDITLQKEQQRPEFELMNLHQNQLEIGKDIVTSKNLPMIFLFGTAGYGRPGFNYLSNDFDDFYMVGLGLSWDIWNWQHGKREKQILSINSKIIETQKETFLKNLKTGTNNFEMEIIKQQELISQDIEIIDIQKRITNSSQQKLENGTITSSQYIDELEKIQQYELNYEIHKLKLELAKINYMWVMGLL